MINGSLSFTKINLSSLGIPILPSLRIDSISIECVTIQFLPIYNRILAIHIQTVNVKSSTKPLKEISDDTGLSKCIFNFVLIYVAFMKDALYYLVYGLLIKIIKLFVIVLLYCIDFHVDNISIHIVDYEVFCFPIFSLG